MGPKTSVRRVQLLNVETLRDRDYRAGQFGVSRRVEWTPDRIRVRKMESDGNEILNNEAKVEGDSVGFVREDFRFVRCSVCVKRDWFFAGNCRIKEACLRA